MEAVVAFTVPVTAPIVDVISHIESATAYTSPVEAHSEASTSHVTTALSCVHPFEHVRQAHTKRRGRSSYYYYYCNLCNLGILAFAEKISDY